METIDILTSAVMSSENLDTLATNLNALQSALENDDSGRRIDEVCDITSLPVFTAETDIKENDGQGGAYSWDATRYLYPDNDGWIIAPRNVSDLFAILDGIMGSDYRDELLNNIDDLVAYAENMGQEIDPDDAERIQKVGKEWLHEQQNGNGEWSRMRYDAKAALETKISDLQDA